MVQPVIRIRPSGQRFRVTVNGQDEFLPSHRIKTYTTQDKAFQEAKKKARLLGGVIR